MSLDGRSPLGWSISLHLQGIPSLLSFWRSDCCSFCNSDHHNSTNKDNSEYLLLNQLGGILGLTDKEIVEVHRNLAEQEFMKQAEVILADGQLTKSKIDQLYVVQKHVGLPAEYAQKVIKNTTTTKMIETAVSQWRIGIQQVRELK